MKIQNNNLLNKLNSNELVKLTQEVKETIALSVSNTNKIFSAADLWRIQNSRKSRTLRRVFA